MNPGVVITKGENGGHVIPIPTLPGCISQGKILKEARGDIRKAVPLFASPDR